MSTFSIPRPRGLLEGALLGALAVALVVACSAAPRSDRPGPARAGSDDPPGAADLTLSTGEDDRHLVDSSGKPFFWVGDTAWSIAPTLDRDEVTRYLDTRAGQGYNVIQVVAIGNRSNISGSNGYGDPYAGDLDNLLVTDGVDPGDDEQYDYWDHLDFVVSEAGARGLRVALVPVWSDDQVGELVREDNAAAFGEFMGARYGGVIWMLGGDDDATGYEDVWRELARGIAIGTTGREDYSTTLMTFHPLGDLSSAQWFHDDEWLDFHMIQGGHCLRYEVRTDVITSTYGRTPPKPFLDAEPIYEDHPYCWEKPPDGYSTAADVRRDAYWSVFGGAAGHTYGHHTVWQFLGDDRSPLLGADGEWQDALADEAAGQMRYVRALMESRPYSTGAPDHGVVAAVDSGPSRIAATRAQDGAYLMIYSPDGAPVDVDLSGLSGDEAHIWWFDPRTGAATDAGTTPAARATFTPPSGADWVLVADDSSRGFGAPGS